MIRFENEAENRLDALIEELIPVGTLESAAIASILLASRAALRDGRIADLERVVWWFHDKVNEDGLTRPEPSLY
jgi:hypothetical protein